MFNRGPYIYAKKAISLFVALVFLFDSTLGHGLAPQIRMTRPEFEKRFHDGYVRLSHEAVNKFIDDYIKSPDSPIRDHHARLLQASIRQDKIRVKTSNGAKTVDVIIVPIPALLKKTGQFAHVGLGSMNNVPAIYVDKLFVNNDDVLNHEKKEIAQWEEKRISLGFTQHGDARDYKMMRDWIKANYEKARSLAEKFHRKAGSLEKLFPRANEESLFDLEEIYGYYKEYGEDGADRDINISAGKPDDNIFRNEFLTIAKEEEVRVAKNLESLLLQYPYLADVPTEVCINALNFRYPGTLNGIPEQVRIKFIIYLIDKLRPEDKYIRILPPEQEEKIDDIVTGNPGLADFRPFLREFIRKYSDINNVSGKDVLELGYGDKPELARFLASKGAVVTGLDKEGQEVSGTNLILTKVKNYTEYLLSLPETDSFDVIYARRSLYITAPSEKLSPEKRVERVKTKYLPITSRLKTDGMLVVSLYQGSEETDILSLKEMRLLGLELVSRYKTRAGFSQVVSVYRKKDTAGKTPHLRHLIQDSSEYNSNMYNSPKANIANESSNIREPALCNNDQETVERSGENISRQSIAENGHGRISRRDAILGLAGLALAGIASNVFSAEDEGLYQYPDIAASLKDLDTLKEVLNGFYKKYSFELPRDWNRLLPAVYETLLVYRAALAKKNPKEQLGIFTKVYEFTRKKRDAKSSIDVFVSGRPVTALFYGDAGHEAKYKKLIELFGSAVRLFKSDHDGCTGKVTKQKFLDDVKNLAVSGRPSTVFLWTHGAKGVIWVDKDTVISLDEMASALLDEQMKKQGGAIDLSHLIFIFNDCYAADFAIGLNARLERAARANNKKVIFPEASISTTSRDRVAWSRHFWGALTEFYIRNVASLKQDPRLKLGSILDFFDGYMYGYGRAPVYDKDNRISGWRTVDLKKVQDPVVFVPMTKSDERELRGLFELKDSDKVHPIFMIGGSRRLHENEAVAVGQGAGIKDKITLGAGAVIGFSANPPLREIFAIDIPEGLDNKNEQLLAQKILSFVDANSDIFGSYIDVLREDLCELFFNISEHGLGGELKIYGARLSDGRMKVVAVGTSRGQGLKEHPDELIKRSIVACVTMAGRGHGFKRICFDPDKVVIETDAKRYVRFSRDEGGHTWFKEEGNSKMLEGTRFTLEYMIYTSRGNIVRGDKNVYLSMNGFGELVRFLQVVPPGRMVQAILLGGIIYLCFGVLDNHMGRWLFFIVSGGPFIVDLGGYILGLIFGKKWDEDRNNERHRRFMHNAKSEAQYQEKLADLLDERKATKPAQENVPPEVKQNRYTGERGSENYMDVLETNLPIIDDISSTASNKRVFDILYAVYGLLNKGKVFDGQEVIYPAGGLDGIVSFFGVPEIIIDNRINDPAYTIERDALEFLEKNAPIGIEPGKLFYQGGNALDAGVIRKARDKVTGPNVTVVLKGALEYLTAYALPKGKRFVLQAHINELIRELSPEKFVILDHKDLSMVPYLEGKGYTVDNNWATGKELEKLNSMLGQIKAQGEHSETSYNLSRIKAPTAVVVMKKINKGEKLSNMLIELKNNEVLLSACFSEDGISPEGDEVEICEMSASLGIFEKTGKDANRYRFSPMMRYNIRNMLNAVSAVDLDDINAAELVKIACVEEMNNQIELALLETKKDTKTVWHIIDRDLLADGQKSALDAVTKHYRDSSLSERIWITRSGQSVNDAIEKIKEMTPDCVIDAALSRRDLLDPIKDENIKTLILEGKTGDFRHIEGIVVALRALQLAPSDAVKMLRQIYNILGATPVGAIPWPAISNSQGRHESPLQKTSDENLAKLLASNPREFARQFIYTLPPITINEGLDKLNKRLLEFLVSA